MNKSESDGENGVASLYNRLRTMILDGVFPPGSTLSQVKLAESLGVSRIPLEDSMRQSIVSYANWCEYYRRLYYRLVRTHQPTRSAEAIAAEHHTIASACIQGRADLAAALLTRHYARTALTVLGQMTPEFDPIAVRMALQIVGADPPLAESPPSRRHKRKEAQANGTRS